MAFLPEREKHRLEERIACFVRKGRQEELAQEINQCRSLFGSDVFYNNQGDIFYIIWRDLKKAPSFLEYTLITRLHPQADIYAPHSRFQRFKEKIVCQVSKDEGSVEAAIRSMDHILEEEQGREMFQAKAVGRRAFELLDLFTISFSEITEEQFKQEQEKTIALLAQVGFNPDKVVNREKSKIGHWIVKGSFGQDSLGRRNKLISVMALQAAYRQAIERQKGVGGHIIGKFMRMREALIFEREFSRTIFEDVADRLRPEAMPSHQFFKYPYRPVDERQFNIVKGLLGTMQFQLEQPRVKTYRTIAGQAKEILAEINSLLLEDRRFEIVDKNLFGEVRNLLVNELVLHQDIYSQRKKN